MSPILFLSFSYSLIGCEKYFDSVLLLLALRIARKYVSWKVFPLDPLFHRLMGNLFPQNQSLDFLLILYTIYLKLQVVFIKSIYIYIYIRKKQTHITIIYYVSISPLLFYDNVIIYLLLIFR